MHDLSSRYTAVPGSSNAQTHPQSQCSPNRPHKSLRRLFERSEPRTRLYLNCIRMVGRRNQSKRAAVHSPMTRHDSVPRRKIGARHRRIPSWSQVVRRSSPFLQSPTIQVLPGAPSASSAHPGLTSHWKFYQRRSAICGRDVARVSRRHFNCYVLGDINIWAVVWSLRSREAQDSRAHNKYSKGSDGMHCVRGSWARYFPFPPRREKVQAYVLHALQVRWKVA